MIDFDALTLADCEEFEELTGVAFESIYDLLYPTPVNGKMPVPRPKVKVLTVLTWLVERKEQPELMLADVRGRRVSAAKEAATDAAPLDGPPAEPST